MAERPAWESDTSVWVLAQSLCAVPATSASATAFTGGRCRPAQMRGARAPQTLLDTGGRETHVSWVGKKSLLPNTHPPARDSGDTSPFAKASQQPRPAKEGHPLAALQLPGPLSFLHLLPPAPTSWGPLIRVTPQGFQESLSSHPRPSHCRM